MTCVCSTYLCIAPEGFGLPHALSYYAGLGCAVVAIIWFVAWKTKGSRGKRWSENRFWDNKTDS